MILETLANAKIHLNVTDPADDAKVQLYLEHASALIYEYMGAQAMPTWDETTAPDVVQAATLKMLAHLYEHRGDAPGSTPPDTTIWEAISLLLMRSRDPALA
jgi:DNA-directed RNA polymerase specialized sigma24 family protein